MITKIITIKTTCVEPNRIADFYKVGIAKYYLFDFILIWRIKIKLPKGEAFNYSI